MAGSLELFCSVYMRERIRGSTKKALCSKWEGDDAPRLFIQVSRAECQLGRANNARKLRRVYVSLMVRRGDNGRL